MALDMACKACGEVITGENEDEFVEKARAHAEQHGHTGSALTREHILGRLGHQGARHVPPVGTSDAASSG